MTKRLKNLLNTFKFFSKRRATIKLPNEFEHSEKIARSIFSPINVTKSGELKTNTYKPPANSDEISVNRLNYANATICKKLSKKIESPTKNRNYFGLAILLVSEIRKSKADIIYSPINHHKENVNPYHSGIKIGFKVKKGEELPSEISYKIKEMTKTSRFYKDPNPQLEEWTGEELE